MGSEHTFIPPSIEPFFSGEVVVEAKDVNGSIRVFTENKDYVKTPVRQEMVSLTDASGIKPLTNPEGLKKFMNSLLRKPSDWT